MSTNAPKVIDTERGDEQSKSSIIWNHLMAEVDPALCTGLLTAYCFITGFMFVNCNSSPTPKISPKAIAMLFRFLLYLSGVGSNPAILLRLVYINNSFIAGPEL
jgi:hypothetical protein